MNEQQYPVNAHRNGHEIKLTLKGIDSYLVDTTNIKHSVELQEKIEMLRLAVKDDIIPKMMFSDNHFEESSTIYYIGVSHDLNVMVSCEETDPKGSIFLDIVKKFEINQVTFFIVNIEDNAL